MAEFASLLPTLTKVGGLVSTGAGLYNDYKNQQYQDMLRSYAENPQKLMAYARGFTQPLTAGVQKGVANEAQGYAAERGLATSPAQEQQIVAQAIAPYIQQEQNMGLQEAMNALGLGGGPSPQSGMPGIVSGLQQLQGLFNPSTSSGGSGTASVQTDPLALNPPQIAEVPYAPPIDLTNWSYS